MFSSLAIQGLVKKGACLIILMVSLSKCEIDSSSTTESGKVQEQQQLPFRDGTLSLYSPSTTTIRSFSASSEDGFGGSPLVRTSYSFSSSLSSKEKADDDDGTTSKEAKEHQPSHSSYQTSVISISSITPSSYAASQQDLTSFRSPEQEAGDKKQAPEQQLGHVQQHARNQFTDTSTGKLHQSNNDNGSNKQPKAGKRQTSSLSPVFPGKREEQMSEVSFPAGNAPVTSAAPAPSRNLLEPPPATNSFERRFPLSTVPGSHRRRAISSDDGEQSISPPSPVSFGKYTNNASELETGPSRSSLIPVHTSIPTGLSFSCRDRYPGYYSDSSDIAKCQVYHMCMTDGRKYTLLCGIGTVFNQLTFVCDHWYNYRCAEAEADSKINRQLWEDFFGSGDDDDSDGDGRQKENDEGSQSPPPPAADSSQELFRPPSSSLRRPNSNILLGLS